MTRLDALAAAHAAATPPPWRWGGNVDNREVYLSTVDRGRIFVMRFVRWGMRGAQPTFRNLDPGGWGTTDAVDLVVREVPYRGDIATIDHPDAELAALSRNALPDLIAVARAAADLWDHVMLRDLLDLDEMRVRALDDALRALEAPDAA